MALIKGNNDFGINADYWKLSDITINRSNKYCQLILGLHFNNSNNRALTYKSINVEKELFDSYFEEPNAYRDVYHASYEYIKNNVDYFKDSVSDEEQVINKIIF